MRWSRFRTEYGNRPFETMLNGSSTICKITNLIKQRYAEPILTSPMALWDDTIAAKFPAAADVQAKQR